MLPICVCSNQRSPGGSTNARLRGYDLELRLQSRRTLGTTLVLAMTTKLRNEEEDMTSIENDFSSLSFLDLCLHHVRADQE
jgi:hypothetical protein